MAGFRTHLTGGLVVGGGSAAYAITAGFATPWQMLCVFSLGVLGGISPDLDSDTGRPIKLLFSLVSTLVAVIVTGILIYHESSLPVIFGSVVCSYVACLIFFFVCKSLTVHRGIMHSVPFAVLLGVFAALATSSWGQTPSLFAGLTTFGGVIVHLILDELNSLGVHYGFIPYLKSSFGTAMKFTGKSLFLTVVVYGVLIISSVAYLVVI